MISNLVISYFKAKNNAIFNRAFFQLFLIGRSRNIVNRVNSSIENDFVHHHVPRWSLSYQQLSA